MAFEKINLAEFDIDTAGLVSQIGDTKAALETLKREQSLLTKEARVWQDVGKQGRAQTILSSKEFTTNAARIKNLSKDYNNQTKLLQQFTTDTGKVITVQQSLDRALEKEATTIRGLREQNAALTKIRNEVNVSTEEGQKQLEQINSQLNKNNATIKENVSNQEQQRLSVGGYTDAIKDALGQTSLFGGEIRTVQQVGRSLTPALAGLSAELTAVTASVTSAAAGTEGLSVAQRAAAVSSAILTAALKVLRVALISTGIGAIVVALGSLIAFLATTQEGIDKVTSVTRPLIAVFQRLFGIIQDLGRSLFEAFSNPRQVIEDLTNFIRDRVVTHFTELFNLVKSILTLDFQGIKDAFSGIVDNVLEMLGPLGKVINFIKGTKDELVEAAQAGTEIDQITKQIEKAQEELASKTAETNAAIAEQEEITRDTSKSFEERVAAAEEIERLAKGETARQHELIDLEIQRLEIKQELNDASREESAELDALIAKRKDFETQEQRIINRTVTTRAQAANDARSQAQAAQDEAIARMNEELDLFVAQQGTKARTLQEELDLERQISEQKIAIFQAELDAKKISQEKFDTEILKLNQELAQKQAQVTANNLMRELEQNRANIDQKLQDENLLTAERAAVLEESLTELGDKQRAALQQQLDDGLINAQEFVDGTTAIHNQLEADLEDISERRREREQAERELQMEQELLALEALGASVFEIQQLQIEQKRERELEAARQEYTDEALLQQEVLNINAQAASALNKIEEEKTNAKLEATNQILSGAIEAFGEETAVGKAAGIAQATINTYLGITSALDLPFPLNLVAAAATGAAGLAAVAKIAGVNVGGIGSGAAGISAGATALGEIQPVEIDTAAPFDEGGRITSGIPVRRKGSADNVLITARTGEAVLNERQQSLIGKDFLKLAGVPGFQTGGIVGGAANLSTVQNRFTAAIDKQATKAISQAVEAGARAGTHDGSQAGISEFSINRAIQLGASF